MKIKLSLIILFFIVSNSCNNGTEIVSKKRIESKNLVSQVDNSSKQSKTIEEDDDFVAKYICPNHCNGSGSNDKGTCKICGMDLIENLDY